MIELSSETKIADNVIGWGVFPVVDSEFKMNEGKFKVPIMAGKVDKNISRFCEIESKIKSDLDSWLCNMYFEIDKMPMKNTKIDSKHNKIFLKSLKPEFIE